jgi:hypothetical protein
MRQGAGYKRKTLKKRRMPRREKIKPARLNVIKAQIEAFL